MLNTRENYQKPELLSDYFLTIDNSMKPKSRLNISRGSVGKTLQTNSSSPLRSQMYSSPTRPKTRARKRKINCKMDEYVSVLKMPIHIFKRKLKSSAAMKRTKANMKDVSIQSNEKPIILSKTPIPSIKNLIINPFQSKRTMIKKSLKTDRISIHLEKIAPISFKVK